MRKITLLLSFIACVVFAQAQTNLLVNPSFETWTGGNPDGWTLPANTAHVGSLTWSQESTIKSNGSNSLKLIIGTTQNPGIQQILPITAGKIYTVSMDYYVVSGDASDVRIWSSFKNAAGFYSAANWTTAIGVDADIQKKLQGSGSDIAAYFTVANGVWATYKVDIVAPADATDFVFECRSYKSSTVVWDNMFFGEKVPAGVSSPKANVLNTYVLGKKLVVKNVANGSTVNIFSALGAKVQSTELIDGAVSISGLSKGLYIVRVGKSTSKIML